MAYKEEFPPPAIPALQPFLSSVFQRELFVDVAIIIQIIQVFLPLRKIGIIEAF